MRIRTMSENRAKTEASVLRHNSGILLALLKEQPSLPRYKRAAIAFAAQVLEDLASWADDLVKKQRQ